MGIEGFSLLRCRSAASNYARLFSSSTAPVWRTGIHSEDEREVREEESSVYRRALRTQRPATVGYQDILRDNSVSFIGTIEKPLERRRSDNIGFHTRLKVGPTAGGHRHIFLPLIFWNELAQISHQYLKPHDLIYVSGRLESYTTKNESENPKYNYQVNVAEVNFVLPCSRSLASKNLVKWQPKYSFEDRMQRRRDRLHLWHIFFANPHEWWDNRNQKSNPNSPDFKHKDTGEALWLTQNDPPWVRQQLQLYDSRSSKESRGANRNAWLHLSPLVYDDSQ
ncbi:protein OSB1, mitochondrial-like [Andrographis paniculata]|uniref:protein OSB1, mitochondrial-like n=1 Tax=Andrographis paniculata TaxID=175694 RepID=UPI0021E94C26|nr:protein OSB1, mitochondrial-like [Andrographis paniculata]